MKNIYSLIQASGGRLTKTKKAIINILFKNHCCLTRQQIIKKLKIKKIKPDRSTIYRELHFLTKKNIIIKNIINKTDYYKIPKDHHHHLVCINCKSVRKVEMNNDLEKKEKQIAKENNFNIISHSLDFYGYCYKCQP